jgi:putative acetyltransferase
MPDAEIVTVGSGPEVAVVRALFVEYAQALGVDLCFQDFDTELATLPGQYAAPGGALFLALRDAVPAGCVAVRPLEGSEAELKRLYVRPQARGGGLGRRLANRAIQAARKMGYTTLRLDTLPSMHEARALYASLGFRETPAYRPNPVAGTTYMALDLAAEPRDATAEATGHGEAD